MNRLAEWLDTNGNKININATAVKQQSNSHMDKFVKLVNYLNRYYRCDVWPTSNKDKLLRVDVNDYALLINGEGDSGFDVILDVNGCDFPIIDEEFSTWDEVLQALENFGLIDDKKYCESVSKSTIDGFKIYENLWD